MQIKKEGRSLFRYSLLISATISLYMSAKPMTVAPIKPNNKMAPHSAVLPNEPVAISQSPMEPHTIAANTPMANKKRTPAFLPAVGWSGTGSRHLRQRRLRTANLIKRRMADRSQVRFETEELGVAGGIIL